ncbi:MAG: lysine--tRNA ligase [bacterium]|nr:lysine--tRNA ligase [bacterium]
MTPLESLQKIRSDKRRALEEKKINLYPPAFGRTHIIAQARELSLGENVTIAGRLWSLRSHGKATFADLRDASGQMQLFLTEDALGKHYELVNFLDIGDIVGVTGTLMKTQAGELSVKAEKLIILSKSLRPLPSTWHGLKDTEIRYRKRPVDLLLNENVRSVFIQRAKIIAAMRQFFDTRGFLEVETPTLQPVYGGANARPFTTKHHAFDATFYLKISDELYLKRLIVGGFEKVYEIDKDFRNEGIDRTHQPEFTMMECYEAYADYRGVMRFTEELFTEVAKAVIGSMAMTYQGVKIDLTPPWKRMTMEQALKDFAAIDVLALSDKELKAEIEKHHLKYEGDPTLTGVGAGWQRGIAIATLFALVEPKLIQPTFIIDFPKETSPLAKVHRSDPTKVERFELFINGWEMANAYSEQNDPEAQRAAFEDQVKARKSGDEEAQPMDEDFVEMLEYGMPPTGGLGVGIDRLVMLLTDSKNMRDVVLFPTLRPET